MSSLLIFLAFLAICHVATAQRTNNCDGYPSGCDRTCGCPVYTIDNPWVEKHFPGDLDLDRIYRKVPLKWDGCTPVPQQCEVGSQLRMTADSPTFLMPHVEYPWRKLTRVCNPKTRAYNESSGWWTCLPLD